MVARTERSPGFGTPLAFPVSQWRSEWRAWPSMARYPLQWRGRAGIAPASEQAPFVLLQLLVPQRESIGSLRLPQGMTPTWS